ncbi:hypothetical protein FCM35_KLT12341 [Carex littledalei]|uniref:Uncharacterized protein n=1 Tax=Carex littledalei TaxID=544730 RepID=A0A833VF68_9POAL|nr:hypothetical protein FCM35_KLT12341 [Carex littledalei]
MEAMEAIRERGREGLSQNPSLRGEEKGNWGARGGTASTIETREGREERERGGVEVEVGRVVGRKSETESPREKGWSVA